MAEFVKTETVTINCPYCDDTRVVKNGKQSGKQRYRCKGCSKQFNDTGALHGHRLPTNQVGAAIDMFYSGMSYQQIAEMVAKTYDIPEPSKETLYSWVRDYTDAAVAEMSQHPAHTGPHWVADQMQVKVGGEQLWNWNVMDAETRYILASHRSPNRDNQGGGPRDAEGGRGRRRTSQDREDRPVGVIHASHQGRVPGDGSHPIAGHPGFHEQQPLRAIARHVPATREDVAGVAEHRDGPALS